MKKYYLSCLIFYFLAIYASKISYAQNTSQCLKIGKMKELFKNSGAFAIYPKDIYTNSNKKDIELSKQFGLDLMNNYSVIIPEDKKGAQKSRQPVEDKSVFDKRNKNQRRVIVELGRMTNPHDIKALFKEGNQDKIADDLKKGIEYSIKNHFEL